MLAYIRLALGIVMLGLVLVICYQSGQIKKWHGRSNELAELRKSDAAAWQAAAVTATAQNKAQIVKVETQQAQITKEVANDYETQLTDLRANAKRLRATPKADPGGTDGTGSPASGNSASGTDADGMPLSADAALQAQEIELRLMHLQNWVERQGLVDPNAH